MISIDPKIGTSCPSSNAAKAAYTETAYSLEEELANRLAEIERQQASGEITAQEASRCRHIVASRRWRNTPEGRATIAAKRKRYRARHPEAPRLYSARKRNRDKGLPDDFVRWTHLRLEPSIEELKAATRRLYDPEVRRMWAKSKSSAAKRGIPFTIRWEDIEVPSHCPVLGVPLRRVAGMCVPEHPSLDRVDNTRGYVPGNVRVISHRANMIKGSATLDELDAVIKYMRDHLTSSTS